MDLRSLFVCFALLLVATPAFAQGGPDSGQPPAEEGTETPPSEETPTEEGAESAPPEDATTEPAPETSTEPMALDEGRPDETDEETTDVSGDEEIREEMETSSDHPAATNSFVLGPHVGAIVPQVFSDLGSWPIFGLELGYVIPSDMMGFERPIQITFDGMYTQPSADGSSEDINLGRDGGQGYDWELDQRMVILELTGMFRFMPAWASFSAHGFVGPRLYLMETILTASSDGADFGENRETKTEVGFVAGGGVEFALGPGTLFGALEFGWSDLNETITGDSNTGAFAIDVGYRFFLF